MESQSPLTPKEKCICSLIVDGRTTKEISTTLGYGSDWHSQQRVQSQIKIIYKKLGVNDRLDLALYCLHNETIIH